MRFHSINVPSEWGHKTDCVGQWQEIVSIQLMSPVSGDLQWGETQEGQYEYGFHSINVPSEWGLIESSDSVREILEKFPFN